MYSVTVTDAKKASVIKSVVIKSRQCTTAKKVTADADAAADFSSAFSNANDVLVYPNPANAGFIVKISPHILLNNAVIKLYDLSGKEVRSVYVNNHEMPIKRSKLPAGIYIYSIVNDSKIIARNKIVLQ